MTRETIVSTVVLLLLAVVAWSRPDLFSTGAGRVALWGMTAAAIVAAAMALWHARILPRGWREANRVVALALAVAVAAAHVRIDGLVETAAPGHAGSPTGSSGSPVTLAQLALPEPSSLNPEELLTRADTIAARISPIDWDVDRKADSLGAGLQPAFEFVRDAIAYDAYSGVLRGASGTYRSRAGNAVDRALLLARLLARKGVATRFAVGTLSDADRQRLFARVFATNAGSRQVAERVAAASTDGAAFHARLFKRAKRDYDVVRAALGERLPPVTKPSREEVLGEMNPHVWVQAEVGGRWIDLDPSFPEANAGSAVATLDRSVPELPADFYQRVRVHLYAEHLSGDALVSTTLLDVTRNAVDLIDSQMFLIHSATDPGNAMGGLGSAIGRALGSRDSIWTPVLCIDGEVIPGSTVNIQSQAPFVSEWLEFELSWPNGRREVTRRPLVDRGGAAWRAASPLDASQLRVLEGNDQGSYAMQALHNVWLSAGHHNMVEFAQAMRYVAATALLHAVNSPTDATFLETAFPFALQNLAWMVWTDHVIVPALNDTPGLRLYSDSPRIAIFSAVPLPEDGLETISDLRRDDLRGLAADSSQRELQILADKKLWFGALQGALEQEALAEAMAAAGEDPALVETTSSRLSAEGVIVLAPGLESPTARHPPHPESKARLSAALAAGSMVVAPVSGLDQRGTWWEIVPGSGDTRAVGELGLNRGGGHIKQKNPMKTRVTPQTNSYGGPRAYEVNPRDLSSVQSGARTAHGQSKGIVRTRRTVIEHAVIIASIAATVVSAGALIYVGVQVAISVFIAADQYAPPDGGR
jgi:hypothetical protein